MMVKAINDHSLERVSSLLQIFQPMESQILAQFVPGIMGVLQDRLSAPTDNNLDWSSCYSRVVPVISSFIQLLSSLYSEQRVVILLDDLQRADSNSILLIQELILSANRGICLFSLFTYRDNDEDLTSIELFKQALQSAQASQHTIALSPLPRNHTEKIIQEMLGSTSSILGALTELTQQKTNGNPFFINQVD